MPPLVTKHVGHFLLMMLDMLLGDVQVNILRSGVVIKSVNQNTIEACGYSVQIRIKQI